MSHRSSSTAWTLVVPGMYDRSDGGGIPYTALNGEVIVIVRVEVLLQHSAHGS